MKNFKFKVAFNESIAAVQEDSYGSHQENREERIPLGALLWPGTRRDWGVGAHAQNGENAVQVCTSVAKDGTGHAHSANYKVEFFVMVFVFNRAFLTGYKQFQLTDTQFLWENCCNTFKIFLTNRYIANGYARVVFRVWANVRFKFTL